jgi:malate synthase
MSDGTPVSVTTVTATIPKVLDKLKQRIGEKAFTAGRYELAARMFQDMTASEEFPEFLTIPAYQHLA